MAYKKSKIYIRKARVQYQYESVERQILGIDIVDDM